MSESRIEKEVCKFAKSKGIHSRKFTSPGHKGVPDRLFFGPCGVFFIEFKKKGGKLSPSQVREITLMRSEGCRVFVIDSIGDGEMLISAISLMGGIDTIRPLGFGDPRGAYYVER